MVASLALQVQIEAIQVQVTIGCISWSKNAAFKTIIAGGTRLSRARTEPGNLLAMALCKKCHLSVPHFSYLGNEIFGLGRPQVLNLLDCAS